MKGLLIVLSILTVPFISQAQPVTGKVTTQRQIPLQGATVTWLSNGKGTATNQVGRFSLTLPKKPPFKLIVSYVGYKTDTIEINGNDSLNILLLEQANLGNVTVQGSKKSFYISNSPIKTEVISSLELKKAACCDLAGCFETQATVQPQTTNIITNSKELRILGLSGIYNQVLIDGFPQVQGLTYTYGISSIPGPLVESIFVSKGANSVLQGYESISGQINVITKDPDKSDKVLLNAYVNNFGEKQFNTLFSFKKAKWSDLLAFHTVQPSARIDKDQDSFLDLPLLTRYMISNRWKKGDEAKWGWSSQIGIKYLGEMRIGGQKDFNYTKDKGSTSIYGQSVNIQQPEIWFKTAYRMNDKHRFALYASSFYQYQLSFFGVTKYKANQFNGYANIQYEFSYKSNSSLKTGVSYRNLNLSENISFSNNALHRTYAGIYKKEEQIPGIFAENTLNIFGDKIIWITGIRADRHNQFGWQITPRTLVKVEVNENLNIRASIGTGWRTANIFSENIGLLASSRDIIFAEPLKPEKALNTGFNATQKFKSTNVEGYVSIDFYTTSFQSQIFPDYDISPNEAIIKNFTGKSKSNGFQAEVSGTFYNRFAAKLGYVYLDVFQIKGNNKESLPFNPNHRLNGSASYMPASKKWHIDANFHWYGKQRLPDTRSNPVLYQMPDHSNPYTLINAQFTATIKKFEVYGGAENIFNFRQNKPLIGWQDPFGKYFDTQFAWGPTRGRELYIGIRFILK